MRNLFLINFILIIIVVCTNELSSNKIEAKKTINLSLKAKDAKLFCQNENLNTDFCILIDMSIHSGKKRFFVWSFQENKIQKSFLVSHGCGGNLWTSDQSKTSPKFSNEENSHLSSLGKYKIGDRGWSNFGVNINYRLHGLDESNSNAYKRDIVFHSWEYVKDVPVYPNGTAEGWGCPAISNNAFLELDPILRNSEKPVLMWIFNEQNSI